MLKAGIVGLPNVGKSTLFNALVANAQAQAANFPFCTIEPNVGSVAVPDERLDRLTKLSSSLNTVPTRMEFVDIAGLVKGASQGEGLGNKFLSNIREVDAIVHVVRCFEDDNILHVEGSVDPLRDVDTIALELALADLAQVDKRFQKVKKDKKADPHELSALEKLLPVLEEGVASRTVELTEDEEKAIRSLGLLTRKPQIYAANVGTDDLAEGNAMSKQVQEFAASEGAGVVLVSAQVEAELVELDEEDRGDFLESLGVDAEQVGLRAVIREAYAVLDLQTYFTTGPKETRAWTIRKGMTAPQAAGVIHTDFEKGFIRANTISFDDFEDCGSEKVAKERGLMRAEGKNYICAEGDVYEFLTSS